MAGIKNWSTSAASNNAAPPNGWPEGQAPSTVNNTGRQNMADIRSWYEAANFIDLGHTPTYASSASFRLSGDLTSYYTTNRPIQCTDSTALYGLILSSTYSSPNTTVTVKLDSSSAALSTSLASIAVGLLDPTYAAISAASSKFIQSGASALATDLRTRGKLVIYAKDYLAGDGVTDDTDELINLLDEHYTNGLKIIFTPGTYLFTSSHTASSLSWVIPIQYDNIEFHLEPGAHLKSTASAGMFFVDGAGKPAGMASWGSYAYVDQTTYAISSASKGNNTVTCTTASDAGNFAVGDTIFVFTGELIAAGTTDEPDSEVNEVIDFDAGTGVITLRWPLAKAYAQENYDSGSSGTTSVGGGGSAAQFGIVNGTAMTIKNFSITGKGKIESTVDAKNLFFGGQLVGFNIDAGIELICGGSAFSMGSMRNVNIKGVRVHLTGTAAHYFFGAGTGTTDAHFDENDCTADYYGYVHLHEGCAQTTAINNNIKTPYVASTNYPFDIRGRCYDLTVGGGSINGGSTNVIYVDTTCSGGGIVLPTNIYSPSSTRALNIGSTGWSVGKMNTTLRSLFIEGVRVDEGVRFYPANLLELHSGAPTLSTVGSGTYSAWLLDQTSVESVRGSIVVPEDWHACVIRLIWANASTGSGDVVWKFTSLQKADGESLNDTPSGQSITDTAGSQDVRVSSDFTTEIAITTDDVIVIYIERTASSGSDTLANDAGLVGIELRRTG